MKQGGREAFGPRNTGCLPAAHSSVGHTSVADRGVQPANPCVPLLTRAAGQSVGGGARPADVRCGSEIKSKRRPNRFPCAGELGRKKYYAAHIPGSQLCLYCTTSSIACD